MDDSFAERMRKRALDRLERNAHIIQYDTDPDYPSCSKKPKSPNLNVEPENKENFNDNTSKPVKPIIAEHLTVRKSVDKMECDEPEAFVMRTRRKPLFPEENYNVEKREDVYVKHCKNRLGTLASKFKTFEEEDSNVPLRPAVVNKKQTTTKRRNAEAGSSLKDASEHKNIRCEPRNSPRKEVKKVPELRFVASPPSRITKSVKEEQSIFAKQKTPEKALLDESVVTTLESQGFVRTVSDAHLLYDFQACKNNFNKENENVNPIPKPQRQFEAARKVAEKSQQKEVSNIYSNSKFQDNMFVQNSKKENREESSNPDPCLLSVAERRKLFEKRLAGETDKVEEKPVLSMPSIYVTDEQIKKADSIDSDENEEYNSGNDYSTCDNESNYETDDAAGVNRTPSSDENESLQHSQGQHSDKEADLSSYPVLQTVKQVKFVSTPKPGRLYPSVSDLDGEVEEDFNSSKNENGPRTPNHDDSFGRDVLCATNSIFSSFQNSRKEMSDIAKSKTDVLAEVKELISTGNDTTLSLSPLARSSITSVECPNETASFTYMNMYSNCNSAAASPLPILSKNISTQSGFVGEDEYDAKIVENEEMDVKRKINHLNELIVKVKIQLSQVNRARKYCLSTSFVNTASHLEAEKFVLLSQLRIEAAENEIQRIKVENSVQPSASYNSVRGNVVISKIRLPIKTSMISDNLKDDIENNLICIIKCGDAVLASEVVPVVQGRIKQDIDGTYIEFPDTITVRDVSSDFKIRVEVYNLVIDKKDVKCKDKDKRNKDSKKNKRKEVSAENLKNSLPSFVMIGYMMFSQDLANRRQWMLNKHHLPLVGMIMMELTCNLAKITVQKRGFLTMYEIISGYGAWSRYWFYLNGDKLSFWKYPEQESVQEAIGIFDLKKCVTKDVVVVGYDVVFRPQTFILKFDPPNYLQQFKNLTEDRLLLSADTEEERISWCGCFNEVLKSVRSWSNPGE